MKHRTFSLEDQRRFAKLSGDYNPLHVDTMAARRLLFGAPVVHGIHLLLWSMDCWLREEKERLALRSIRIAFRRPIRVGEEAVLSVTRAAREVSIVIKTHGATAATAKLEWDDWEPGSAPIECAFPEERQPREIREKEIARASGTLPFVLDADASGQAFPNLSRCVAPVQIAALLASTRLVGMECPGLHSLYSELSLTHSDVQRGDGLTYEVAKFDQRFGLILMKVWIPGMNGTIRAFFRPAPKAQHGYQDIKKLVTSGEFAGQRAVVVGGSRGLGEVTAKILAAGGAEVMITYHQGEQDARRIIDDIRSHGGVADCSQLDVLSTGPDAETQSLRDWSPSHLYFFATPFIAVGTKGMFSAGVFSRFCDYYVAGLFHTTMASKGDGPMHVFYPSSVFVDDPPTDMAEYTAAKMAGEALCAFLSKTYKSLTVYRPRLPRMSTDQTVSLLPVSTESPLPIMLEHLRLFRDTHGAP